MNDYDGDQTIGQMTIEESALNDADMFNQMEKDFKKFTFRTTAEAVKFVGRCVGESLEYLGVHHAEKIHPQFLDTIQNVQGIRIETRDHYRGKDLWRNGIYLYKQDIMVRFISSILTDKHKLVIYPGTDHFYIITNCRLAR